MVCRRARAILLKRNRIAREAIQGRAGLGRLDRRGTTGRASTLRESARWTDDIRVYRSHLDSKDSVLL